MIFRSKRGSNYGEKWGSVVRTFRQLLSTSRPVFVAKSTDVLFFKCKFAAAGGKTNSLTPARPAKLSDKTPKPGGPVKKRTSIHVKIARKS